MQVDEALVRENADWRIREIGIGAELVRKQELPRLQPYLDSFLVHGKIAHCRVARLVRVG